MKPNDLFVGLPKAFWASVRLVSQFAGYTERGTKQIKVPSTSEIRGRLDGLGIDYDRLNAQKVGARGFDGLLQEYFAYRADRLNLYVKPRLMDGKRAKRVFQEHFSKLKPSRRVPMNKQSGDKKAYAYLTGLVNMLIEANSQGLPCDYDRGN